MSLILDERSLGDLDLGARPLLVCDIDEVVLEYVTPFQSFLKSEGYRLEPRSFRLVGNILSDRDDSIADTETIWALQQRFFAAQANWQGPVETATEALEALAGIADVVFLTAMPPKHAKARRALLDRHALTYPMIASEAEKGPIVARLHGERRQPIAFVDDIARNLRSVRDHVPDCLLLNLMANAEFGALAPAVEPPMRRAASWDEARHLIELHFGAPSEPPANRGETPRRPVETHEDRD